MHPIGEGTGPLDHGFASDDFPDPSIFLHFDPPDPCFFMPDEIVLMIVRRFNRVNSQNEGLKIKKSRPAGE